MLTIRTMQLAAFEADLRRRVKARVLADCRARPPDDVVLPSDEALAALLDQCEKNIDRYDGNFMLDAHRQLLLMIEFGPDFDKNAWARAVFEDPDIPGTSKLDVLDVHAAPRRGHAKPCR